MDDYDNSSIAASLEDFEHDNRSPTFGIPSMHSAYRSERSVYRSSESEPESEQSAWSPPGASFSPAWRKGTSGWARQHRFSPPGASISSSTSPTYQSAGEGDETLMPANVPLPRSPSKQTPAGSHDQSPEYGRASFPQPFGGGQPAQDTEKEASVAPQDAGGSYIRFAMRAEMQHRTEPYEGAVVWVRDMFRTLFRTKTSTFWSCVIGFFAYTILSSLFQPPKPLPAPDMLRATQLAKTFEPLIYYSQNGVQQISDLQDTSVAVWDLCESVRSTNMTSGPIIVRGLDDLSESLKTLAIELTRFFAHVDGDVDGILITMEWAKRHLQTIEPTPSSSFTSALDNVHGILSRTGILESSSGSPTIIGTVLRELFGDPPSRKNSLTLQRTFNEFLTVLEESINNELQYSVALFGLFEAIDSQFKNLQRTVVRESDQQDREEGEMLSSLWTRVLGTSARELKKFEKNKQLLASVRQRTVQNKGILLDHNGKLLQLKSNLEVLRKKLVSPLVRSNDSSVLSVEEQIAGLDDTYAHLKAVREQQKQKTLQMLYSTGSRRVGIVRTDDGHAIEGGH
ncbi:hypothetical protein EJ08DRAFT_472940 [Tothia fuscella]|uniref:Uncharacterized protein n=1 Tax=Tothia fuscella TaxID=1048955 RepID=A0A9P4U2A2_9PEZI|nr:hypothetical protein EJ08DRAFT_472940 [Tothia fuscella]